MKTHAILFASVLLVGCQASRQDTPPSEQHVQSISSVSQGETGKYTDDRVSTPRWQDINNSLLQDDLWNFIGEELKMQIPDNARVREQQKHYLKQKSYLHDVALRAEPYMYWIVEQIKQHNMPMELVLLPIMESAFDPKAISTSNAAGLWQIVPQTGKNYGLEQNQWYDGRRDVVASTTVALDIMQRLNRMFDGDWLLTFAAYNSGEGRIIQAIKHNKAKGRPTDFWSLGLPRETTIYVPKILALSSLIKNSKQFGITLPKSNVQRALAQVEVGRQIGLRQAAEMSGLSLTKLKSFNTGYKRNVTAPNGPHYIMLPKAYASQLCTSLAGGDIVYEVRTCDALSDIAKRLNVKIADLQRWDDLRSVCSLKVGQTLKFSSGSI
nr:murein transglycosylase D [Sodalis-like endosymbiont of Proechinophthirus fluctus]